MKKYLIERMLEASTWRNIVILISGLFGHEMAQTEAMTIVTVGMQIAGAIGVMLPDKIRK
jgi:hypothetical protein